MEDAEDYDEEDLFMVFDREKEDTKNHAIYLAVSKWRDQFYLKNITEGHSCVNDMCDKNRIDTIDPKHSVYGCRKSGTYHVCPKDTTCNMMDICKSSQYICYMSGEVLGNVINNNVYGNLMTTGGSAGNDGGGDNNEVYEQFADDDIDQDVYDADVSVSTFKLGKLDTPSAEFDGTTKKFGHKIALDDIFSRKEKNRQADIVKQMMKMGVNISSETAKYLSKDSGRVEYKTDHAGEEEESDPFYMKEGKEPLSGTISRTSSFDSGLNSDGIHTESHATKRRVGHTNINVNNGEYSKMCESVIYDILYSKSTRININLSRPPPIPDATSSVAKYYRSQKRKKVYPMVDVADTQFMSILAKNRKMYILEQDAERANVYKRISLTLWHIITKSSHYLEKSSKFHIKQHTIAVLYMLSDGFKTDINKEEILIFPKDPYLKKNLPHTNDLTLFRYTSTSSLSHSSTNGDSGKRPQKSSSVIIQQMKEDNTMGMNKKMRSEGGMSSSNNSFLIKQYYTSSSTEFDPLGEGVYNSQYMPDIYVKGDVKDGINILKESLLSLDESSMVLLREFSRSTRDLIRNLSKRDGYLFSE